MRISAGDPVKMWYKKEKPGRLKLFGFNPPGKRKA